MAKERDEPAAQQGEDTQPQWQPPGAATRSLTLAELPAVEHLRRSRPVEAAAPSPAPSTEMELSPPPPPTISGVRPGAVSDPIAYQHTISASGDTPAASAASSSPGAANAAVA